MSLRLFYSGCFWRGKAWTAAPVRAFPWPWLPRLAHPCPVLQICCLLPRQPNRAEDTVATNQLRAISAALRRNIPVCQREEAKGGRGRAAQALRVTISIQPRSPWPGARQSHAAAPKPRGCSWPHEATKHPPVLKGIPSTWKPSDVRAACSNLPVGFARNRPGTSDPEQLWHPR